MPPVGVLRGRILSRRRSSTRGPPISSGILRADGSRPVHRFDPRPIHAARSRGPHEAEEYPYPSPPRSCLARQVSHGSLSIVRLRQTVTLVHNPLAPGGYWWPRVETMPGGSSGCGGGLPLLSSSSPRDPAPAVVQPARADSPAAARRTRPIRPADRDRLGAAGRKRNGRCRRGNLSFGIPGQASAHLIISPAPHDTRPVTGHRHKWRSASGAGLEK